MKNVLAVLAMGFLFVSCEGGGAQREKAKGFEAALEAKTGQSYTLVKVSSTQSGYSVFKNDATGEFVAYNLTNWNNSMTMDTYYKIMTDGDYLRGLRKVTETNYTEDPDGMGSSSYDVDYYYYGGLKFENTSSASKDLEIMASLKEDAAKTYLSQRFESEYSLSTSRAQELANLALRYQKLENLRELTSSEKDIFAIKALGVSMKQMEAAMKKKAQGDETHYQELLHAAASVNNTTPEQIGKFFQDMDGSF